MRLPRLFAGSEDAALCEVIEAVGDDAREGLCASIWPGNLYLINALRAHLAELGLIAAKGKDGVKGLVTIVIDGAYLVQM